MENIVGRLHPEEVAEATRLRDEDRKKGPFILRAMQTTKKPGNDLTFWDGIAFMSASSTERYCTLPGDARRFETLEAATQGIIEWTLRYPVVIGCVEVVDMSSPVSKHL